jgi:hypothetical protein
MSAAVTVITNDVPRDVIYGHELTLAEMAEFDYIDWAAVRRGDGDLPEFFRYKGQLCEGTWGSTLPADSFLRGWDGWYSESFFSGVLFRYPHSEFSDEERDWDHVIVGRYYS